MSDLGEGTAPAAPTGHVRIVALPAETLHALAAGDVAAANRTAPVPLPASLALVRSCGFVVVGERWDPDDGLEIVHEVRAEPG